MLDLIRSHWLDLNLKLPHDGLEHELDFFN